MLLDEADIDAIVKHLGREVQFYDSNGIASNGHYRDAIRDTLRSYISSSSSKSAERFKLVKIAFDRRLEFRFGDSAESIGAEVVRYVDATLAAMAATPDTGPSAEDAAGLPSFSRCVERLEDELAAEQKLCAEKPTTTKDTGIFRDGFESGLIRALQCVAAMEKTGAEPPVERGYLKVNVEIEDHDRRVTSLRGVAVSADIERPPLEVDSMDASRSFVPGLIDIITVHWRAMEKTGDAVSPAHEIRPTRSGDDELLVD